MAINYLILLSRQGKVRLAKWFTTLSPRDKAKIVKDVSQLVLARRTRMCNFLEYKDTKIVYRRYASLFFIAGCSSDDNELISLEIIHRYVEQMDKYYGNVCELDIIFSFTKAYYILDEILLAGELQESSKKNVLRCINQQDSLEDMEYLPLHDFDVISTALSFSTAECRVKGSCDLYTTKAAGSDKKLFKKVEKLLEDQRATLFKLSASLSPAQRKELAASFNISRSPAFRHLSEPQARRIYTYLIATLNASHPDYDFSHTLRPHDFCYEPDLCVVMANVNNTMKSVRPHGASLSPNSYSSYWSYCSSPAAHATLGSDATSSPIWSPYAWTMMDQEMALTDCMIFSFQPREDPFDGDESAIWRLHYLFYNKDKKRVAYLYVRGVPVIVSSPALAPNRRGSNGQSKRHAPPLPGSMGANKRAKYWLGDQLASHIIMDDEDDYDDDEMILYDPDNDIEIDPLNDPSTEEEESDEYDQYDDDTEESEREDVAHSVRGVSEDIAANMEM
ncbi:Maf1 regulator-domain-containing protein [Hypoxylon sp. NC1633]|nr:Maf1 regulator-domain-containing protein [Hypoxylon sp. NC1633]